MQLDFIPPLLADIFGLSTGTLAAVVIPVVSIVIGGAIAITAMYFHHRRRELWHETARIALERGQPLPPPDLYDQAEKEEIEKDRVADHDVRGGMVLIAVGIGLWIMFSGFAPGLRYIGAIPGLIGVALLLYALIMRKDRQPPQDPPARS